MTTGRTIINSEGQAQQLHALGRATSAAMSRELGRAQRQLIAAGHKLHSARVDYARAADSYREAWTAARTLFNAEQLADLGFPNMPAPKRPDARPAEDGQTRRQPH